MGPGSCHLAVVTYKVSVKIGKAQEALKQLTSSGSGPFHHRTHLGRVQGELSLLDHKAQKTDRRGMELTFFRLDKKLVLDETPEDQTDVRERTLFAEYLHQIVIYLRDS